LSHVLHWPARKSAGGLLPLYLGCFLLLAPAAYATSHPPSAQVPSVKAFLTPDGRFDLEAARQSGYEGPLDPSDIEAHMDPAWGELRFSTRQVKSKDEIDQGWWDGFHGPGMGDFVLAVTSYDTRLVAGGRFREASGLPVDHIAEWDGAEWRALGEGMNDVVWSLVVYNGDLFAGGSFTTAGGVSADYIARWDGVDWNPVGGGTDGCVRALTVHNGHLIAGGSFNHAGGISAHRIAQWDGIAWASLGAGMDSTVLALCTHNGDLIAGGDFRIADGDSAKYVASWDGSSWNPLGEGMGHEDTMLDRAWVSALTVYNGDLIAGGLFSNAGTIWATQIARWDGSCWNAMGLIHPYVSVSALLVHGGMLIAGGGFLYAGGTDAYNIASWDGDSWSPIGGGLTGDGVWWTRVNALAEHGGELVAGGWFINAGDTWATHIASWDGVSWSAFGTPGNAMNSGVVALTGYGGGVVAAGQFTHAGPTAANYIARWDDDSWTSLGAGLGSAVQWGALAVYNGDLIAGGYFTEAGGCETKYIARWDGNAWSALGTGMDRPVVSLSVYDGSLVAGGLFTRAGGVPASYVASWNGTAWTSLGSGTNGWVRALDVCDGTLIAGGSFTQAGGIPASRIARWDGNAWSGLGAGLDDCVWALTVYGDRLVVGGEFAEAGGTPASRIAAWGGSAWSSLGSGVEWDVRALAVYGDCVFAGGELHAGGKGGPAGYVGRWDGSTWTSMGSGMNCWVLALLPWGGHLYAGGYFTTADGTGSFYVARWTEEAGEPTQVGALTLKADCRAPQGSNAYLLSGNVEIGEESGENYYLKLGPESSAEVDLNAQTVSILSVDEPKLVSGGQELDIEGSAFTVTPIPGEVDITGRIHTVPASLSPGYVEGNLHILLNQAILRTTDAAFGHAFFGPGYVSPFEGFIDLQMPPVHVVEEEIEVTQDIWFSDVAVFRMGEHFADHFVFDMETGYLRYRTGIDYTVLELVPSQGAIGLGHFIMPFAGIVEIEIRSFDPAATDTPFVFVAITPVEVSIGIPPVKAADIQESTAQSRGSLLGVGLALNEGAALKIVRSDEEYVPLIDGSGYVNLEVLYGIHFTVAEAEVELDWPSDKFTLEAWAGGKLGPLMGIDFASGTLGLDYVNGRYFCEHATFIPLGSWTFGTTVAGTMEIDFDENWTLSGHLGEDISVMDDFVLAYGEQTYQLRNLESGRYGLGVWCDLSAPGLSVQTENVFTPDGIRGSFMADCEFCGFHLLGADSRFRLDNHCMTWNGDIQFGPCHLTCGYDWCPPSNPQFALPSFFCLGCPADLHVYDALGRHVGLTADGLELGIPGSHYFEDPQEGWKLIQVPELSMDDTTKIVVDASADGQFTLSSGIGDMEQCIEHHVEHADEPMSEQTRAEMHVVRQSDLNLHVDYDGDGEFDLSEAPDTLYTTPIDTTRLRIAGVWAKILWTEIDSLAARDRGDEARPSPATGDSKADRSPLVARPGQLRILWSTNRPATSLVQYGTSDEYGYWSSLDTSLVTRHSTLLPSLPAADVYHYRVISEDSLGHMATSPGMVLCLSQPDSVLSMRFDEAVSVVLAAAPNPLAQGTVLHYELAREGHVTLRVYDVRGRLVATLADGVQSEGPQSIIWDGKDGNGAPVAQGVYFARLQAGPLVQTKKILLLR